MVDNSSRVVSTTFQIADGWVRTKDLIIRTPELTMSAVGGISLNGELDFESTAAFTPEVSQRLRGPVAGLFGRIFTDSYKRIWKGKRCWVLNEGTVVVERSGHQPIRLEGINLTFSDISTQQRFPFQIRAAFQGDTRLAAKGLIGPLNLDSFAETPFSAEGQLEANLESLRATLQDWVPQITPLSGRMNFDWNVSRTTETPLRVSGKVQLEDASLQPQGFTRPFTIQEADLEFDPNQAELKNLKIAIGEGTIEGYAKVNDFEAPRVEFEFGGDYLDVSALESLIEFSQKPSQREKQGEGQAGQGGTWFTKMTGSGQLKFKKVQHGTLILEPFEATARIANSQLVCEPLNFGLHGGTGSGRLQIDLSQSEPSASFSVQLEQVDVNQLLSANTQSKDRLFGNLQVSLQLETKV